MGSTVSVDPRANQNVGAGTRGNAFKASVEAGLPFPLPRNLTVDLQVQLIYQHTHANGFDDGVSTVSFHSASGFIERLGARIPGELSAGGIMWRPYVRVNVLRYFSGIDEARFAGNTAILPSVGSTEEPLEAGVSARINDTVSVYATTGYWFYPGSRTGAPSRVTLVCT